MMRLSPRLICFIGTSAVMLRSALAAQEEKMSDPSAAGLMKQLNLQVSEKAEISIRSHRGLEDCQLILAANVELLGKSYSSPGKTIGDKNIRKSTGFQANQSGVACVASLKMHEISSHKILELNYADEESVFLCNIHRVRDVKETYQLKKKTDTLFGFEFTGTQCTIDSANKKVNFLKFNHCLKVYIPMCVEEDESQKLTAEELERVFVVSKAAVRGLACQFYQRLGSARMLSIGKFRVVDTDAENHLVYSTELVKSAAYKLEKLKASIMKICRNEQGRVVCAWWQNFKEFDGYKCKWIEISKANIQKWDAETEHAFKNELVKGEYNIDNEYIFEGKMSEVNLKHKDIAKPTKEEHKSTFLHFFVKTDVKEETKDFLYSAASGAPIDTYVREVFPKFPFPEDKLTASQRLQQQLARAACAKAKKAGRRLLKAMEQ